MDSGEGDGPSCANFAAVFMSILVSCDCKRLLIGAIVYVCVMCQASVQASFVIGLPYVVCKYVMESSLRGQACECFFS